MLTHTGETTMIIKTSTLVRLIIGTGLLCLATADSGVADTLDLVNPANNFGNQLCHNFPDLRSTGLATKERAGQII